jgi:succinoglycan biosynthesis transport protein ExoP
MERPQSRCYPPSGSRLSQKRIAGEGDVANRDRAVNPAEDASVERPVSLADYLAILRRRKWIVIALPIAAALAAYVMSTAQSARYKASADVYVNLSNLAGAFANVNPSNGDPTRLLTNQATLARSDELAKRVVQAAGVPGVTPGAFLGVSTATARQDADFLDLSVTFPNPRDAVLLANAYAEQFTKYKNEVDTGNVNQAIRANEATINSLKAKGQAGTAAYDAAVSDLGQLRTFGRLLANNASVQSTADGAAKVRPLPKRSALIGGLLGFVLGIGLAFLTEALDRRVRSEKEIENALEIPLLGRIPRPERRLDEANKLVMLEEPQSVHAQPFRKLRTSLEFVNFDREARTILITSAMQREGKSTTAANLAVALARAGRRAALVDLDLRRPMLHTFFNLRGSQGFTDVVVTRTTLDKALQPVPIPIAGRLGRAQNGRVAPDASNGHPDVESVLHVLPCGTIPPAADEFLESDRVSTVLEELSQRFEIVLVDAPPMLAVGDVLTLTASVDAMIIVAQLGIGRRQLAELTRELQTCRTTILGYVLTGVSHGDSYSYEYGYDPHVYEPQQRRERV